MAGSFKYFRLSCMILLLMLALQFATAEKKSKGADQNKLLAEYAAFEKQVHETLTSFFSKLEVEETCEAGDPNCDPAAGKLPEELQPAFMSLVERVDNLDDILRALLPEPKEAIYFATAGAGIKVYSPLTSEVSTVVSSNESCYGIAYDSIQNKIYWSTLAEYKIYRANIDGSQLEAVWNTTTEYAFFQGLAFDWVTGNLYVGTRDGNVIVCDTSASRSFTCHNLLSGRGDVDGIVLNPIDGTMYWTSYKLMNRSSIWKGGMDGCCASEIVGGLGNPRGIAIDFQVSRLYWTVERANEIKSSNLDGSDVQAILQNLKQPFGIAFIGNRIFWGEKNKNQLRSSNREGTDIRTHHNGTNGIRYLAVMPNTELPRDRKNHCKERNCSGICVLTTDSSKCLE